MRAPAFGSRTSLLQQALRDEACCNKKQKLSQSSTTDVQRFMRFQSTKAPTVSRERVECVVIGAGVVGLAIARELAMVGREVWVIEADTDIGTGISSRNSEVIHAGIYYPPGSLKAKLCVEGRKAMYSYCEAHGVPYKRAGKLIVATQSQQVPVLEKLAKVGKDNGVTDLRLIEASEAQEMEPQLQCVKALWSPSSGILDSHSFMLALQADAEEHGASFAFNTSMIGGAISNLNIEIYAGSTADLTAGETTQVVLCANMVINSTGLHAQSVARSLKGLSASTIPKSHYARGCYFSLSGVKSPFSHLIYPVPEDGGLGCHVTMDLSGQIKFGPDVEWLPNLGDNITIMTQFDYTVEPRRMDKFYSEIRKYYPSLPDRALQPDYAGIRPKLSGSGELTADFLIQVILTSQYKSSEKYVPRYTCMSCPHRTYWVLKRSPIKVQNILVLDAQGCSGFSRYGAKIQWVVDILIVLCGVF